MESQKGVTLTSLVIYIMLVLIIVGILATITATFQGNLKEINKEGTKNTEIDKFNVYFLKEVKKQGNNIDSITDGEIIFTLGDKYTFRDNCIYLNENIKISEDIEKCIFSSSLVNGKTVITVTIKAKNAEEKTMEYVLNDQTYSSLYEDENNYINNDNSYILPAEYQEVEYIEVDEGEYIDTGLLFKDKYQVGIKFEFLRIPSNEAWLTSDWSNSKGVLIRNISWKIFLLCRK